MTAQTSLRLWPGVVLVIVQWLLWYVVPIAFPDSLVGMAGGAVCGLLILMWWMFFSRAPWSERVGAIILMVVLVMATKRIVHESIAGAGMGMLMYVSTIPGLCMALVAWAVITRRWPNTGRRAGLVLAILLACAPWVALRTGGISGSGSDLHWRWTPSPEERLLARPSDEPPTIARVTPPDAAPDKATGIESSPASSGNKEKSAAPEKPSPTTDEGAEPPSTSVAAKHTAEWPGFRGSDRDGVVRGVRIDTDWSKSPPVQLWRRPIGPGWSSFAVDGDHLYTQEQRGDDEIVACYKVATGEPVWRHRDPVRFWESNGGAGPRATPTLSGGRVYAFGATGILNALDAGTGAVVWARNVASETKTAVPGWGFTSSPLVIHDLVIVAADATLVAYDLASGRQRWVGPVHRGSYSSPHRTTIDGVEQVVLLGGAGVQSLAPSSGAVLWEHAWQGGAIVQPALLPDGNIIINNIAMTGGNGVRRVAVAHGLKGWSTEERWTSNGLKPFYNDFVVHKGHAYGFDGNILASIDLDTGKRVWKGGRYGAGQLMLLPDQDVLLVISEEGELALVGATPDQFKEITRFTALNGKTWNHPVLVGDVLLVRNGEEMAAFRLSLAGR